MHLNNVSEVFSEFSQCFRVILGAMSHPLKTFYPRTPVCSHQPKKSLLSLDFENTYLDATF